MLAWERVRLTSMEIRRWTRFLRHTPVGDCTSSEDVPDAWSLSPSEPIFRFSCTMSTREGDNYSCCQAFTQHSSCIHMQNRRLLSNIIYSSLLYKIKLTGKHLPIIWFGNPSKNVIQFAEICTSSHKVSTSDSLSNICLNDLKNYAHTFKGVHDNQHWQREFCVTLDV